MWGPRNGKIPDRCAIVVQLQRDQYRHIAKTADAEDRSMSSVIRQVIEHYFAGIPVESGEPVLRQEEAA